MLDRVFQQVTEAYPSVGQLRQILALRGGDAFAAQDLGKLIARESSFVERVHTSHEASLGRARRRPLTARDLIDHWGYRPLHCTVVGNAVCDILGPQFRAPAFAGFWRWTFVSSAYAAVLADVLRQHEDEAFAGAFLRHAALLLFRAYAPEQARAGRHHAAARGLTSWEAERQLLGVSHLDLARRLAEHWGLPESLWPAFDGEGEADSLAGLIVRAQAAAARHGFVDADGAPLPPPLIPPREPILDAYLARKDGPEGVLDQLRGMMATARIETSDAERPVAVTP